MRIKNKIFQTLPCIIHAPQKYKWNIWNKLEKHFHKTKKDNKRTTEFEEIDIITWNNKEKGIFEKSLESKGWKYHLKGSDQKKWDNYKKFDYNVEVCKSSKKKYIMGCDSHDVIILSDMEEIISKFEKSKSKMIFNCERFFYPDFDEPEIKKWKDNENKRGQGSKYPYLNSGAWIGEREFVLEFFEKCKPLKVYNLFNCDNYPPLKKEFIGCDQSIVHHVLLDYPEVKLDYTCEIFMNIANMEDSDIEFEVNVL